MADTTSACINLQNSTLFFKSSLILVRGHSPLVQAVLSAQVNLVLLAFPEKEPKEQILRKQKHKLRRAIKMSRSLSQPWDIIQCQFCYRKKTEKKDNPALGETSSQTDQAETLARTILRNLQGFFPPSLPLLCFPWLLPTPHKASVSAPLTFRPSGPFSPGGPMSPGKPCRKRVKAHRWTFAASFRGQPVRV